MENQFAFAKIKLSTPRHKNGYLYLSTIMSDEGLVSALDIRFWIDEENKFRPTKHGIRINKANFGGCLKLFSDSEVINDFSCEINSGRSLNLTYTEGLFGYGKKVDLRFFLESENYSGPTIQGITISLDDFKKVSNCVNELISKDFSIASYKDLFANKIFTPKPKSKQKDRKPRKPSKSPKGGSDKVPLPPELEQLLK